MVEPPASTTIFRRRTIGVCDDGHRNCVSRGYEGSWVGNFDMYFRNGTVPKWEEMPSRVMGPPTLFAPANQGGIQKLHSSSRPEPPLRRRSGGTRISPALFGAYLGHTCLTLARQVRSHPCVQAAGDIYHSVVPGALQQAARNQAAIPALAMHRDGRVLGNFRQRTFKAVQRMPTRACNVGCLDPPPPPHVEHANPAVGQPRRQVLHR